MQLLTERYASQIAGVLSCFDRVVIAGTFPGGCFPEGMAKHLGVRGMRLFDYPRVAEPLREELRQNAETLARTHGRAIECIRAVDACREEDRIKAALAARGVQPGLVHLFSAMEPCAARMPWHAKASGRTTLRY